MRNTEEEDIVPVLEHNLKSRQADLTFGSFEQLTERHLVFEEQQVFPVFDQHADLCPAAEQSTRQMRAQHDEIRSAFGEVGVALQLHQIREVAMQRLAQSIDQHAADEDAWAAAIVQCIHQAGGPKPGLMDRLRGLVAALRSAGSRGGS